MSNELPKDSLGVAGTVQSNLEDLYKAMLRRGIQPEHIVSGFAVFAYRLLHEGIAPEPHDKP